MASLLVLASLALASLPAQAGVDAARVQDAAEISLDELVGRIPHVDGPGSDPQKVEACAELERRLKAGVTLSSEQWRHLLLDTGVLSVRSRWPAGEPFAVSALEPEWLVEERIVLRPTDEHPELKDVRVVRHLDDCWNCLAAGVNASVHQTLGVLPLGRQRISFRIEVWAEGTWARRLQPLPSRPWLADYYASEAERKAADAFRAEQKPRPLSTGELVVEVEVVPTLDDAILPVSTPEVDLAVRKAFSVSFQDDWDDQRAAALFLNDAPALDQLGLSLDLTLFEGKESRWSAHLLPRDRDPWRRIGLCGVPLPLPLALEHDADARRAWSLRIRGTNERILHDWEAERRWLGTLELSLDELLARSKELRKR